MISSNRIFLQKCNTELLEVILKGDKHLEEELNITVTEAWNDFGKEVIEIILSLVKEHPNDSKWYFYLPIDKETKTLLGSCGYKGKPDSEGMVEIGYEVAKSFRNKGFATEITKLLILNAFKDKSVKTILAQTKAENNASVSVLKKCHFEFIEEYDSEEDGLTWKWIKLK